MKQIFEPVKLNHLTLKNRLIRSATWEGVATEDGSITPMGFEICRELVRGGIGGIITGFTSVRDDDVYLDNMMRLSRDSLIPQYRQLTDMIHEAGIPVLTQLALGAFYRSGIQTEPDEMTEPEIREVIGDFVQAAVRAQKAGFDGVQIHGAHFFFLSRFLSPAVNHRRDQWGGSTENRVRIIKEIIEGIRKEAPDLHITAKLNSSDFFAGGIDENEALKILKLLEAYGLDSAEISGNNTSMPGIRPHENEAYFAPFAARAAAEVAIPVMVVGGLRSLEEMNSILNQTGIQVLALSRPLLRQPDLPNLLKEGRTDVSSCISCNLCYRSPYHRCVFRDRK